MDNVPGDMPIPVSGGNWLKDSLSSEDDKRRIFETAFRCREEILTKHYGEPLDPKYVLNIKRQLEDRASVSVLLGDSTPSHSLLVGEDDPEMTEFFAVRPIINDYGGSSERRSEVRVDRVHVVDADGSDNIYIHEYPFIRQSEMIAIWLGATGTDELPRVNLGAPSNYVATVEHQEASFMDAPGPKPIHKLIYEDMDREYVELLASRGVALDDLSLITNLEFPDPTNPDGKVLGYSLAIPFFGTSRTLRDNQEDVPLLKTIEEALKRNVVVDRSELSRYNLPLLENTRKGFLDFNKPLTESSQSESELLRTISFALIDIDRMFLDHGVKNISQLGYKNYRSESLEQMTQQEKDILKKLGPIIIPHCYSFDYGPGANPKTQPKYRIDYSFLRDENVIKQINSIISTNMGKK